VAGSLPGSRQGRNYRDAVTSPSGYHLAQLRITHTENPQISLTGPQLFLG